MAGLRAADRLIAAGATVVLLEARTRPGGRVFTIREPFGDGLFGEAGAIRLPSTHRRTLALVEQFGLSLVPFASGAGDALTCMRGLRLRAGEIDRLGNALSLRADERGLTQSQLLERYVAELPASLGDAERIVSSDWEPFDRVTWPAWLASRGASPGAVALMTVGGDSRELSALYVLRQYAMLGAATLYKIGGGMDLLPRAMEQRVRPSIRYGAAVTRVDPRMESVDVTYRRAGQTRSITASRVLITTPVPVLRQVATADEQLRQRLELLAGIDYFPAARVLVQSRRRSWLDEGLSGSARTDRPAEVWDSAYDAEGDAGVLGATVGGELGRRLAATGRPDAVRLGATVPRDAFPALDVRQATIYRWPSDRWAGGAFAVFRPGRMIRIMPAAGRAIGRVHFAGEHTAAWMGWTEGAIQSADRAVDEILS